MLKFPPILQACDAFCSHGPRALQLVQTGQLAGLRLAVKDLFQLTGEKNGAGNPDWFDQHVPAENTALSLQRLLDEGATFVGFTHTDELAYSLEGNNGHYGIIENPKLTAHHCGGSSMGSAAVVAADLADIALGTDTGGSVRVPASYCGIYSFRPSKHAIDKTGLLPLAPEFDTIGWFCRDATLLNNVGALLLDTPATSKENPFKKLLFVPEFIQLATPETHKAIQSSLAQCAPFYLEQTTQSFKHTTLLNNLPKIFRILQGRNAAETHAQWLSTSPRLAPDIQARFDTALAVTDSDVDWARARQIEWIDCLNDFIPENATLALPTTPTTAPQIGQSTEALRQQLLQLTAIAGLAGLPQCHLPLSESIEDGLHKPSGISLIKHQGLDKALLAEVAAIGESTGDTP